MQAMSKGIRKCRTCGVRLQRNGANPVPGRHNAAIKILSFEILRCYQLADAIPPWYSPVQPKAVYQDNKVTAYWDVPVFAEHLQVRANRVDARFVGRENKEIMLIEMSCPWMDNKKQKEETLKYAPLRLELKRQHPEFKI